MNKNIKEDIKEYYSGWYIRKLFHILFILTIIYYLFPQTILGVPNFIYIIILFFLLPLIVETYRLHNGIIFKGLHKHEKDHIASYAWFCFGAGILLIFFPQQIAAPCIVATALGDPVIGMTKPYRRRFMFSIAFFICLAIFILFRYEIIFALFAGAIAFIAESFEFRVRVRLRPNIFWSRSRRRFSKFRSMFDFFFTTDDDFMMQIIPAVVLWILFLIFPEYLPEAIINPHPGLLPYA